jgi:hypothetical protein
MRYGKIISLLVCMLLIICSVLTIPNQIKVKATEGVGSSNSENELDKEHMWKIIEDIANISNLYPNGGIIKGRFFGSTGEFKTGIYLADDLIDNCSFDISNVKRIKLKPIENKTYKYTNMFEVKSYVLIVNHEEFPFAQNISKNDIYPLVATWRNEDREFNFTRNFENTIVYNFTDFLSRFPKWDTGINALNLSFSQVNNQSEIIGNVTYIGENGELPTYQEDGGIFLMEEAQGCDELISDITNSSGIVLIKDDQRGYESQNASNCTIPVVRINSTLSNLTNIIQMLENGTLNVVDSTINNNTLTFIHNLSSDLCGPSQDYFLVYKWMGKNSTAVIVPHCRNMRHRNKITNSKCVGIIIYDAINNDAHNMFTQNRGNKRLGGLSYPMFALPGFSINRTIGEFLGDRSGNSSNTITGHIEQVHHQENHDTGKTPLTIYNVEAYLNIAKSPNDKIVVLSNRYDSMWGECPGDSGVGTGIIMGIAKYMKYLKDNHSIEPKYNITFLFTTGEEVGYRGAQFYSDSHEDDNISLWIGTDQLGFEGENVHLHNLYKNETHLYICENISEITRYENRSGYDMEHELSVKTWSNYLRFKPMGSGAEDIVFHERPNCSTILIHKGGDWPYHHRRGLNLTEGDVLQNIDKNEVNVTYELTWNISKYFLYNPHCWFKNLSRTSYDSSSDSNGLVDSINASFTIRTRLPHDYVMVNASLINKTSNETIVQKIINYTVTSQELNASICLTLPENESAGLYELYLELYNSTGKVKDVMGTEGENYNDTSGDHNYSYLYPLGPDTDLPEIIDVSENPDLVGFGYSATIEAESFDNESGIDEVKVNITYPDYSYGNFSMNDMGSNTYQYVFSDTWLVGQYNYTIWATDLEGNTNSSSGHSFNVSAQASIAVCSFKDGYGSDEFINLTDPPNYQPLIGYELIDEGKILHMWNKHNSYYFNTSSGLQMTNHYDEFWSHNVLMLGYYDNDQWNLIYRTDELSNFIKNIETDNETFVNATLWKDLTYQGYDFRLAIKYHLNLEDADLTVVPYIKNLGESIPYDIVFGWEIKDIKIADTYENDWFRLYNGTDWVDYKLSQTLDKQYTDMDKNTTFYLEGRNEDQYFRRTLYLKWNNTLDYLLKVKNRTGQYNAPVSLFIKVGTLGENQEKSTIIHWLDSDEWLGISSNELDSYCGSNGGPVTLENALDGIFFWQHDETETHWFIIDLGETYTVKKVRGRSLTFSDPTDVNIYVSDSKTTWGSTVASGISTWQDTPIWQEVDTVDKTGRYVKVEIEATENTRDSYIEFGSDSPPFTIFDIYGDIANVTPVSYDAYPENGSTNTSTSPTLNITVSDPNGDNMNITWYSNNSGSWVAFGTNNSVGNGTYRQTFSNASTNGQWWHWKVNVTDGTNYAEENIYKFYTGWESKINNTGSTNIKGYLLIQVQFYSGSTWVVVDDTINETTPRNILWEDPGGNPGQNILALDTIFNGIVKTSDLPSPNSGTYRIYAALRDPEGNALVTDDETELEATYEFTITFE